MAAHLVRAFLVLAVLLAAWPAAADGVQQSLRQRVEATSPVVRGESLRALAARRIAASLQELAPDVPGE